MIAKTQASAQAAAAQTRLPDGWQMARFGDVVRNVDVNERSPLENGLDRSIGLEHIEPDSLHIKTWGLVEEGTSFTRKFVQGQVLFGKRRAYQRKVAIAEFDGICSGDILVFEPANEQLIPELLPFIAQSEGFFQHALGTSAGSLSPRTRWRDLAEYTLPLPPKDEQHRIAEILWTVEETISSYLRALNLLPLTNAELFKDCLSRIGQIAPSTEEPLEKRTVLGDAIEDIIAGKSPACSSEPALPDGYGVLKVSAVSEEGFIYEENKALLDQSQFEQSLEVKEGFLLVTRANALKSGVGRACIVQETRPGLMLSDTHGMRNEVVEELPPHLVNGSHPESDMAHEKR